MVNVFYCFIILFSIVILFLILNLLYQRRNANKNFIANIQKYLAGIPNFDYSYLSVKGFNFALIPQPLSCGYKILKQYHEHIKHDGVILITLVPFSFYVDCCRDENSNIKYLSFFRY
jgi:hypothetical protein